MSSQYTRHIIKLKAVINSENTGESELLIPIRPNKITIIKPIIKINLIMLGVIIFSKLKKPPVFDCGVCCCLVDCFVSACCA